MTNDERHRTCIIRHSSFNAKLRRRDLIEPIAQLAPQQVGPSRLRRITVALGKRVEPIERNPSCKRVL
jgi:hypothetical protein